MTESFISLARILGGNNQKKKSDAVLPAPDYSKWNETNPCFRCGQCCSNVTLEVSTVGNKHAMFGELYKHVKNPDNPYTSMTEVPNEPGVYFVVGKRGYYLCIRGACPELQGDRSCGIHGKPRPRGCVTSGLDSIKCITSRVR